jgi:hypothetical protein
LTFPHPGLYWIYGNKDDVEEEEESGRFDVDVVLTSLFMRLSDDICNRLDSEITMKVTISDYHGALTIPFSTLFW